MQDTLSRLDKIELDEFNLREELKDMIEHSYNRSSELREIRKGLKI